MGSRKPSARAKKVAEFKASYGEAGADELWAREDRRREERDREREQAHYQRACASKKRYATQGEARQAIADCARHGTTGLECYRCEYCKGWHLTSHPWDD